MSAPTVGVRCRGPRPWKLYVPVRLSVTAPIFVAARYLSAGTEITRADLRIADADVTRERGVLRADEPVEGMVLRRDLAAGEPLRGNLLDAPTLVRRGQRVTLLASGGPIRIRMGGTAMGDGRRGERIRVRNTSSGRIVEGIVRSSDQVEIGLN